jgi:biotin carboxyl carrier protein
VRDLVSRYETAYQKGFASCLEYVYHRMEANETAGQLAQLVSEEKETRAAREQIRHQTAVRDAKFAELERGLGEAMEKARIRIGALREELTDSVSSALTVTAPCAGTVLTLAVKGVGAYVHDGDVLGELACSGERLEAELLVPESGIGRIKPGQGVKLLYDAFPYERYGVKYGTVRWVSPSSVESAQGRRFRALADIDTESVRVDNQPRRLVAGMGGTARVVVGRRSIISAAFAPLRQLQEAFRDAPAKAPPIDQEGQRSRAN